MNTIEEYLKNFKEEYQNKQHPESIQHTQLAMKQLLTYCEKSIQDINTRDVRNWLNHLQTNGYAKATVRTKLYRIKPFFKYCLEEAIIQHNCLDSISIPEDKQKLPRYLEMEQMEKFKQLVSSQLRQRAVIEVLYSTGVRVGELCNMKKEDIHWSERMIHIQKGKGKKDRIVLFTKECEEYLKAYLNARHDELPFLFLNRYKNGPLGSGTIRFWFKTYRKELKINMSAHTLRHTFAAHLAIKGMPLVYIQTLLGHENPKDTQLYARLHDHAQKQKYDEWM